MRGDGGARRAPARYSPPPARQAWWVDLVLFLAAGNGPGDRHLAGPRPWHSRLPAIDGARRGRNPSTDTPTYRYALLSLPAPMSGFVTRRRFSMPVPGSSIRRLAGPRPVISARIPRHAMLGHPATMITGAARMSAARLAGGSSEIPRRSGATGPAVGTRFAARPAGAPSRPAQKTVYMRSRHCSGALASGFDAIDRSGLPPLPTASIAWQQRAARGQVVLLAEAPDEASRPACPEKLVLASASTPAGRPRVPWRSHRAPSIAQTVRDARQTCLCCISALAAATVPGTARNLFLSSKVCELADFELVDPDQPAAGGPSGPARPGGSERSRKEPRGLQGGASSR